VTRRPSDLLDLPSTTDVLAHWHGEWRTDVTVGQLKSMPVGMQAASATST